MPAPSPRVDDLPEHDPPARRERHLVVAAEPIVDDERGVRDDERAAMQVLLNAIVASRAPLLPHWF